MKVDGELGPTEEFEGRQNMESYVDNKDHKSSERWRKFREVGSVGVYDNNTSLSASFKNENKSQLPRNRP